MKREKLPDQQQNSVVYLKDSPGYRMVFGVMEIVLGLLIMVSIFLVIRGSMMFGTKGFFNRMWNIVNSNSSDYYDIRADKPDYNSPTIIYGNDSMKTSPNVRSIPANLKNEAGKALVPGSFGSTTFYIVPNDPDTDLTVELEINTYGLKQFGENDPMRLSRVECTGAERETYDAVDDLLDGHILFFAEKDSAYHQLLPDGKMCYNTSEHRGELNENGEYEITVYWIWTEYYNQLIDTEAEDALFDNSQDSIEMAEYIKQHENRFFYKKNENDDLSDQYNNSDYLIHQNTDYIGFEIIANN